jgi:hypothetical protein
MNILRMMEKAVCFTFILQGNGTIYNNICNSWDYSVGCLIKTGQREWRMAFHSRQTNQKDKINYHVLGILCTSVLSIYQVAASTIPLSSVPLILYPS